MGHVVIYLPGGERNQDIFATQFNEKKVKLQEFLWKFGYPEKEPGMQKQPNA